MTLLTIEHIYPYCHYLTGISISFCICFYLCIEKTNCYFVLLYHLIHIPYETRQYDNTEALRGFTRPPVAGIGTVVRYPDGVGMDQGYTARDCQLGVAPANFWEFEGSVYAGGGVEGGFSPPPQYPLDLVFIRVSYSKYWQNAASTYFLSLYTLEDHAQLTISDER